MRMTLFNRDKKSKSCVATQTGTENTNPFFMLDNFMPLGRGQFELYKALREAVPIVDAAITKITRLTGGFSVECSDKRFQEQLNSFIKNINVGGNQHGLESFVSTYFEQLLTYGVAVGEIVVTKNRKVYSLYNTPLSNVSLRRNPENTTDIQLCRRNGIIDEPVKYQDLTVLSVLNPEAGEILGNSLLKGLPFVSSILMKIYNSIGQNWDRAGNIRYAVTYKPQNDAIDRAYAKDRAMQIASEWSNAMQKGSVKDFIAVGDVDIKVIGADNQILDSQIPVKQMLEQIVAKTGLPPFMLGLSWSTTERMSSQQADVLTSELCAYRRILTPVIEKICDTYLRLNGFSCGLQVCWDEITLQDEVELSRARLYNAQALKIETELSKAQKAGGDDN